jgi:hypothetical protein
MYLPPLIQKVVNVIRQRLGIGSRSAAADIDLFRDLHQLVGDAIGNVGSGRCSGIGTDENATLVGECQDGGSRADLAGFETGGDAVVFVEDLQICHRYFVRSFARCVSVYLFVCCRIQNYCL